jgi:hypothetical protein
MKEKRQVGSKRLDSTHVRKRVVAVPGAQNIVYGIPRELNVILKIKVLHDHPS